jgi:hypothetical protein
MANKKEEQGLEYGNELKKELIANIEFNPDNPREERGRFDIGELKKSIRKVGVLVPLVAYRKPRSRNKFILLEGERRLRACQELYEETKDKRFATVPVNILATGPDKLDKLVTMFNMHTKRRRWSKAAEAEGLKKIIELSKSLDPRVTSNTAKLAELTGLGNTAVEEELTYLKFSPDLRRLVQENKIGQYNLILLGRNLKSLQEAMPDAISKYDWDEMTHILVEKVLSGTIRRSRDFNTLTSAARECIQNESESVFMQAFDYLLKDPKFSLDDMDAFVQRELRYRIPSIFKTYCQDFKISLDKHAKLHNYRVEDVIYRILKGISESISKVNAGKA